MGPQLVSLVLALASTDGSDLQLVVQTSESATVTLQWGQLQTQSNNLSEIHHFGPLGAPRQLPVAFRVIILDREYRFLAPPLHEAPTELVVYDRSRLSREIEKVLLTNAQPKLSAVFYETRTSSAAIQSQQNLALLLNPQSEVGADVHFPPNELSMAAIRPLQEFREKPDRAGTQFRIGKTSLVLLANDKTITYPSETWTFLEGLERRREDAAFLIVLVPNMPPLSEQRALGSDWQGFHDIMREQGVSMVIGGGRPSKSPKYERTVINQVQYVRTSNRYRREQTPRPAQLKEKEGLFSSELLNFLALTLKRGRGLQRGYGLEGALLDEQVIGDLEKRPPKTSVRLIWPVLLVFFLALITVIYRVIIRGPRRLHRPSS